MRHGRVPRRLGARLPLALGVAAAVIGSGLLVARLVTVGSPARATGTAAVAPVALASVAPSVAPPASFASAAPTRSPSLPACPAEAQHFPAGYRAYHTEAAMCRALVAAATAHPDIARLFSIGKSWQGREIWAMEISTHIADGTHPPGALFDGLTHGLEHLSLEMPLAIMGWLLDGYGHDPTITALVQTRAIFIVFDVNPDGAAYDIAGGRFHEWRKNRQPGPGGAIGTDINRNFDDHWGCCGRVSANASSAYYRGAGPFSTPEAAALRDFVESLVFDGRQEIRVSISFHASGRLVLWPYGYTHTDAPAVMSVADHSAFLALGRAMARLNGYRPEQASSLYLDSGTARDWYYGEQRIFAFTFELGTGTYQPSSEIGPEVQRNRAAVLYLVGMAACPVSATGSGTASCSAG